MARLVGQARLDHQNKIKALIASKGGTISNDWVYVNATEKIDITCRKGHHWSPNWVVLGANSWCPECVGHVVHEEDVRKFIEAKEGKLDTDWSYINNKEKFFITCKQKHRFETCWHRLDNEHWCPFCVNKEVDPSTVQNYIVAKDGKLDANWSYVNAETKFWITCKCGYRWEATWNNIQKNHWCPSCVNHVVYEDDVRKFIETKGWKLDTDWKYISSKKKFWVTCERGHRWETHWNRVWGDHPCPYCSHHSVDANSVQELIKFKGGKLDANWEYINRDAKFWITCHRGHRWETNWGSLQQDHWCHHCRRFKVENELRNFLEAQFNDIFPRKRPLWLRYPLTKYLLELDGYNEQKKIAFEYQGIQHYELCYINKFSEERLKDVQQRDAFKKQLCSQNGVRLIVMPYWISKENWATEIMNQILIQKKESLKIYA